jgi:hypothetical protein
MALMKEYYVDDHRFDNDSNSENGSGRRIRDGKAVATIADCVLFSLLQFADEIYGVELVQGLPSLKRFQQWFGKRDSANIDGMLCDENLRKIASHWIKEQPSVLDGAWEIFRVLYVYLGALWQLATRSLVGHW